MVLLATMNVDQLISEAERCFSSGNHDGAVQHLTTAARSDPNEQQQSNIEQLIQRISQHVVQNDEEGQGERGIGGSLMNTMMSSNNGSSQSQLGKLALLAPILGSSKNSNSGGFNLQSVVSLLGGQKQNQNQQGGSMGSSGLSSLASKFFGSGSQPSQQYQSSQQYQPPQQHQQPQQSGGFSLSSMASSLMGGNNNSHSGQQQYGSNSSQGYYSHGQNQGPPPNQSYQGQNQGPPPNQSYQGQNQGGSSTFSSLASMAGSYLSGSQKPQEHHGQGHQGFQGQGNQGYQGGQGFQGGNGFQGNQGFQSGQGNQDFYGNQGNQGNQRYQENQGYHGNQGNQGYQGYQGEGGQGYQGNQGGQGNNGNFKFSGNFVPDRY